MLSIASAITVAAFAGVAHAAPELDVLASAALGDDLGGRPVAVGLSGDGVVLASQSPQNSSVVRLDPFGAPAGAAALAGRVDDLAVDRRTGDIAVIGDVGLTVLSPDLDVLWQRPLPARGAREPVRRVDVGERGTIAVSAAGEVRTFSPDGDELAIIATEGAVVDLAVFDAEGVVVTTGWRSRSACGETMDLASLAAYASGGGPPLWQAYGDLAEADLCGDHHDLRASTRGVAVARGDDGLLYLLAEVEGAGNVFRERPGAPGVPASNVAFDSFTVGDDAQPALFAYYARFTPAGEHKVGQFFLFPDDGSLVEPRAIAADVAGNVHITGVTSHSLGAAHDVAVTEELHALSGFYQVVDGDFGGRREWRQLELDGLTTDVAAFALAGDRAVSVLDSAPRRGRSESAPPGGPLVIVLPLEPGSLEGKKRPEREGVGTFGYESGVAGSDPACYCDAGRTPTPLTLLALTTFVLACLPRPRRRA
ncbi:hypothetical protein OV203_06450 [Nannocystis sp. ILAH1]|uniref:hypothetical protein n=1 Tax=Nannocystis sp. ILAH1 TaxID=2996789 RepID=UPI00226D9091|nr:hypothetical protein [Nannocystis sp. ILAH1]MCY0986752.1 hypothetical protein [Nannocystis sp. ILAH1]